VWEPSILVAASVVCCLLSVCLASDLGNYARYAWNFVTPVRNRGRRARIWRQILHRKWLNSPKCSPKPQVVQNSVRAYCLALLSDAACWFLRWQTTAILILLNPKILLASGVRKAKMNHFANLNQNRWNNCGDIVVLWFFKRIFKFQQRPGVTDASPRQSSSKSVKRLQRYRDFSIFQDGGRQPSWICFPRFWITHEAYLVVFTGVQNLVGIHAAVSIIWVWIVRMFGLKMPIHVPEITVVGRFDPLNGEVYQQNPQNAHTYKFQVSSKSAEQPVTELRWWGRNLAHLIT